MQNSPNTTSPFAGYLIMCVLLFSTAIALNWPLLLIFSGILLLITGVFALTGRFSELAASVTPDDAAPQMSAIDEVQEMRQALNRLDHLEPIPDRPSISYDYAPPSSTHDASEYTYTAEDYREIARYARSREPDTRPPAWR